MSKGKKRASGQCRWLVLIFFTAVCGAAPGFAQQADAPAQPAARSSNLPEAPQPMPDPAAASPAAPGNSEAALAAGGQAPAAGQSGAPQAAGADQQEPSQKPLGTAAAPPESTSGATASRPAGAVIAPAKQRRARTILIRVGLIVGAAVALGSVIALTHATPSQPPQ
jgi:hypothetical protein